MAVQSHLRARFSLDDSLFQKGVKGVNRGIWTMRRNLLTLGVTGGLALTGITAVALALSSPISHAAAFEDAVVGFEQLLGSADAARERIMQLQTFAATTPFEMPGVIVASRILETLTHGALSTGKGLRMVGDIAAGAGQPIQELAVWVGRLYDGLQSGRPIGRAAMRLQELGVLSGEARTQMEKLQKQGIRGARVWAIVEQSMSRFSGLMEKRSATWNGKMSNLADAWGIFMTRFGMPIKDSLTPFLDFVIKALSAMIASGTRWGTNLVNVADTFSNYVFAWIGAFSSMTNYVKLWGTIFKLIALETIILIRDGLMSALKLMQKGVSTFFGSEFYRQLSIGAQLFGDVMAYSTMALLPRLWEGLKVVIAAMAAGIRTVVENVVELLLTGIMRTVDYFAQGWRKAIWDPLVSFAKYLADLALGFGKAIMAALTGGNLVAAAKELAGKAKGAMEQANAKVDDSDWQGKLATFMATFKAGTFQQNFDKAKANLDTPDPLNNLMKKWQEKGDRLLPDALAKLKDFGMEKIIDPVKDFFGTGGVDAMRDKAAKELMEVIQGLAPVGKAMVGQAISKLFDVPKPLVPGATGVRSFSFGSNNLLDVGRPRGLSTSGLTSGNLANPQLAKAIAAQKARDEAKAQVDKARAATEGTQVDIRQALQDLLGLTKDVWTKS